MAEEADPGGSEVRAVLADDSVLLREGIGRLLEEFGMEVVGHANDGDELMALVREHRPDVAVIDVRMPPSHTNEGLMAAIKIRRELPEVGVLMLSQYIDDSHATELLFDSAAGFGYLLKDRVIDINQFVDAVRRVASGGSALDPDIVARLIGRAEHSDSFRALTDREHEVLSLMAEGRSNSAIAQRLVITRRAAEKHVSNIFQKLELDQTPDDHRRVLAVLRYMQRA